MGDASLGGVMLSPLGGVMLSPLGGVMLSPLDASSEGISLFESLIFLLVGDKKSDM